MKKLTNYKLLCEISTERLSKLVTEYLVKKKYTLFGAPFSYNPSLSSSPMHVTGTISTICQAVVLYSEDKKEKRKAVD